MSWSPEVFIRELRPWPDSVHVVRGRTGEKLRYLPERTCHLVGEDLGYTIAPTCGACGHKWVAFNYCPMCGAKVVD